MLREIHEGQPGRATSVDLGGDEPLEDYASLFEPWPTEDASQIERLVWTLKGLVLDARAAKSADPKAYACSIRSEMQQADLSEWDASVIERFLLLAASEVSSN